MLTALYSAFLQSTQPTLLSSISLTTFLVFPNISAVLVLEMSGQGEAPLGLCPAQGRHPSAPGSWKTFLGKKQRPQDDWLP